MHYPHLAPSSLSLQANTYKSTQARASKQVPIADDTLSCVSHIPVRKRNHRKLEVALRDICATTTQHDAQRIDNLLWTRIRAPNRHTRRRIWCDIRFCLRQFSNPRSRSHLLRLSMSITCCVPHGFPLRERERESKDGANSNWCSSSVAYSSRIHRFGEHECIPIGGRTRANWQLNWSKFMMLPKEDSSDVSLLDWKYFRLSRIDIFGNWIDNQKLSNKICTRVIATVHNKILLDRVYIHFHWFLSLADTETWH